MTMTVDTFINEANIDINTILYASFRHSQPDPWFEIIHHVGDTKQSWFKRIFGIELPYYKKVYTSNIIYNKYANNLVNSVNLNKLIVSDKHIINTKDNKYPVWYLSGIHIRYKNKYGNESSVSNIFYIGNKCTDEEIKQLVNDINNKVNVQN